MMKGSPRCRPWSVSLMGIAVLVLARPASGAPPANQFARAVRPASPYRNFRYRLRRDSGTPAIAGFDRFTLKGPVAPPSAPSAQATGRTLKTVEKYVDVTLERGLSVDPGFPKWTNALASAPPESFFVDEADEAGRVLTTRHFAQCRAVESQQMPDLDANTAATRLLHIVLRCAP